MFGVIEFFVVVIDVVVFDFVVLGVARLVELQFLLNDLLSALQMLHFELQLVVVLLGT